MKEMDCYVNDQYLQQYTFDLFERFGWDSSAVKGKIYKPYMEESRFFHNIEHIKDLLKQIHHDYFVNGSLTESELEVLVFAAWFHDIVYEPGSTMNEYNSAREWLRQFYTSGFKFVKQVEDIILDTEKHEGHTPLSKRFQAYDMRGLYTKDFQEIQQTEYMLFKEHQRFPYFKYQRERIYFLRMQLNKETSADMQECLNLRIKYVQNFIPQIGVYAGSFNPFHVGHLNILKKAEEIFDKVIVLIGHNPDKPGRDLNASAGWLSRKLKFRDVAALPDTMTITKFITDVEDKHYEQGGKQFNTQADVTLIRGLRNGNDLAYEQNQQFYLKTLKPDLKTVLLLCDPEFMFISSSDINKLQGLNTTAWHKFCV